MADEESRSTVFDSEKNEIFAHLVKHESPPVAIPNNNPEPPPLNKEYSNLIEGES